MRIYYNREKKKSQRVILQIQKTHFRFELLFKRLLFKRQMLYAIGLFVSRKKVPIGIGAVITELIN